MQYFFGPKRRLLFLFAGNELLHYNEHKGNGYSVYRFEFYKFPLFSQVENEATILS